MHFFGLMQPTFVNETCPGKSWKKRIFESWKTLEFGLYKSWKVLEKGILMSVRTLITKFFKRFFIHRSIGT